MKNKNHFIRKATVFKLALVLITCSFMTLAIPVGAETENNIGEPVTNGNYYSFSTLMSCNDGNGYATPKPLSVGDPLVGVRVASLELQNFSSTLVKDGVRYFLKSTPDIPLLTLNILADINNIAGTGAKINYDSSPGGVPDYGYVDIVGMAMICVQHIDANGVVRNYSIKDVFSAEKSIEPIILAEEGLYSCSLMFETKRQVGTKKVWDNPFKYHREAIYEYRNYRLDTGEFYILNSNTMAFIFDKSGNELQNGSIVSNGFILDYASSHYLNVTVKREVLLNGSNILEESTDIRFNTVGVNKRIFEQPGLYTITVSNHITGAVTIKRILVEESTGSLVSAAAYNYPEDFSSVNNNPSNPDSSYYATITDAGKTESPNVLVIICCICLSLLFVTGIVYLILRYRKLYY